MSRRPAKSGFNPSKEQYRCLMQNCNRKSIQFKKNRQFFSLPDEFWNFYDGAGSVSFRFSTLYSPLMNSDSD